MNKAKAAENPAVAAYVDYYLADGHDRDGPRDRALRQPAAEDARRDAGGLGGAADPAPPPTDGRTSSDGPARFDVSAPLTAGSTVPQLTRTMSADPAAAGRRLTAGHRRAGAAANGAIRAVLMGAAIISVARSASASSLTLIFEAVDFLGRDRPRPALRDRLVPAARHVRPPHRCSSARCIVTVIAMLVAAPIGLAAAIYLSEYASRRSRNDHQADPRDPRRHPERRARVLRPHL